MVKTKILNINSFKTTDHDTGKPCIRFSAMYDDGWLIICNYKDNDQLEPFATLSLGLSSVYFDKFKNLTKSQINKRLLEMQDLIMKRKKRYKVFRD